MPTDCGRGDHVAVLLPNDERTHEVAFGLQRSGIYYTFANWHLTAEEAAYIVNDCGAHTLITSSALAPLAEELVALTPGVDLRLILGELLAPGHTSYDEFVEKFPGEPLDEELEGFAMLYSSGHHRAPQGHPAPADRRPLRHQRHARADARAHHGLRRGQRLSQPGAAVPLRAAGLVDDGAAHGRHRRADGALRPRGVPGADRAAPGDPRAIRAHHVRAHAQAARRGPGPLRRLVAAFSGARGRAVCPRGEAPDDRVVGPDHPRVLLGHGGAGHDVDHAPTRRSPIPARSAGPSGARSTSATTTARRCPPARTASSTSGAAPGTSPSSTTTIRRRPSRLSTTRGGPRCGTSVTSTRTATST